MAHALGVEVGQHGDYSVLGLVAKLEGAEFPSEQALEHRDLPDLGVEDFRELRNADGRRAVDHNEYKISIKYCLRSNHLY